MITKHIVRVALVILAFVAAPCAIGQTPGTWTVGDQGAVWTVDSAKPTGAAPADAYEPALIALPNSETEARWTYSAGDQLYTSRCAASLLNYYKHATRDTCVNASSVTLQQIGEKKIRLNCGPATAKRKDNILGYGVRYFGHGHQGYGSISWDELSSYATIRADPRSSCQGIILNASNYMEPALTATTASGATLAVLAQDQAVYYIEGDQDEANESTWIRRGMSWIWAVGPSDYNDTKRRAEYAAAGLVYPGSANTPAGVLGWYCFDGDGVPAAVDSAHGIGGGTTNARYLKGPSNADPFGGRCHSTAAGPATLTSDLISPSCWDGTNLTAAGGRDNMRYITRKGDNSRTNVCPKTTGGVDWRRIPAGEVKNIYLTTGFSEYGSWSFTSDRMRMASTECPDAASPCDGVSGGNVPATVNGVYYSRVSLSPCRSTGLDFCYGETLHADYTFGWYSTFDRMERECLGIPVRGTAPTDGPAECNFGMVDRYTGLMNNPPSGAQFWSGGCITGYDCRDSVPSKPKERYAIIEGQDAGTVVLKHH